MQFADTYECSDGEEELAHTKLVLQLFIVVRDFLRALRRLFKMILENLGISDSMFYASFKLAFLLNHAFDMLFHFLILALED